MNPPLWGRAYRPVAIVWSLLVLVVLLVDRRPLDFTSGFLALLALALPHVVVLHFRLVEEAIREGRSRTAAVVAILLGTWAVWFATRGPMTAARGVSVLLALYLVPPAVLGWRRALRQGAGGGAIGQAVAQVFLAVVLGLVGWLRSGPQTADRKLAFAAIMLAFVGLPVVALLGWALWTGKRKSRS
jgi:hypothetical protein